MVARDIYFITHPDVRVDPQTPVPDWSLSPRGLARMRSGLAQPWVAQLTSVYSSAERKAREAGEVIAERLGAQLRIVPDLGEVDRSATGYLPHEEHEATADAMFANPGVSARGWETARHAQARIASALQEVLERDRTSGSIAIVSHGAVGAFLLCWLTKQPISRERDQPGTGGGNYFAFRVPGGLSHGWQRFDA
ncbi:MAG TPA: histidine phosphatase family protein [Polyangiales bacterium]|nr:histidine phosphatase family protein [Polyangiales bacterium]